MTAAHHQLMQTYEERPHNLRVCGFAVTISFRLLAPLNHFSTGSQPWGRRLDDRDFYSKKDLRSNMAAEITKRSICWTPTWFSDGYPMIFVAMPCFC
jgi:hypothetical protein